ncbi:SpoIIE family protein phosphatase [Phytomonospora sp. NPDC050363]|uniref:SpoIIE family protein phosphatase n=1 Tax=Phytomonospora sp. NPDC050363 TaxID=3155642 RepID=UPI00340E564D
MALDKPLGLLADNLRLATVLVDAGDRIVFFDPIAEEITGYAAAEVIGREMETVLHADGDGGVATVRRADGTTRTVMARNIPVRPADGAPVRLVQFIDVGAARGAVTHLGLLDAFFHQAPVGYAILDQHLRYVMVNQTLADFNERPIADHIGRSVRDVVVSPDIDAYEQALFGVLESGEPLLNVSIARSPTTSPDARAVASASWFRVTGGDGEPLGLCGLIGDITTQEARSLVDARGRHRAQLLTKVGTLLAMSLEMEVVCGKLAELLTADFCDLAAIDVFAEVVGEQTEVAPDDPHVLFRLAGATRLDDPRAVRLIGQRGPRPLADSPGLAMVLKDNRARMFPPEESTGAEAPEWMLTTARELDAGCYLAVPLRARDTTIGALSCLRTGDRTAFDEDDMRFAEEVAARTAATIDNVRLYQEERRKVVVLQMSLLPGTLPSLPEAELAHRYLPGRAGQQVGGDWYDAFVLPGHRMAMVIGDVAGHGVGAAATMGRYRSVVQTLASIGLEPGALLTRLNQIATSFGETAMATCAYVQYDPWDHRCTIASAGHLPPIVIRPGARAEALDVRHGPMLGASEDALYETDIIDTPPGTRLLLYSDGLVESRTISFEAGVARLAALPGTGLPLPEHADLIMSAAPGDSRDDRALLLAELRGTTRAH